MSPEARPTKSQRRDEARQAAERLQAQQAAAAKRSRNIAIGALAAGLVVLIGVVVWIFSQAQEPGTEGTANPAGVTVAGGIPVGADGVAGARGGSAADATVLQVYFDFMCPYCAMFELSTAAELSELRAGGDVIVEYHPISILDRNSAGTQFSTRSATAAALVADQAPEQFLDFLYVMFVNQPGEGSTGMTDELIADLARQAGVAETVAATIADGSYFKGSESFAGWVVRSTEQAARDLDRLATPTVVIDGEILDTNTYPWTEPGMLTAAVEAARG